VIFSFWEQPERFLGKIRSMFAKICLAPSVEGPIFFYRGNYHKRKTKCMKQAAYKSQLVNDVSALNEEILEAAEKIDGESLAPEVSARTAEITAWDESPEDAGWRVHERPMENQVSIAEQLVSEGNEQADREQRTAAGSSGTGIS
jgi:hypothetical protein